MVLGMVGLYNIRPYWILYNSFKCLAKRKKVSGDDESQTMRFV